MTYCLPQQIIRHPESINFAHCGGQKIKMADLFLLKSHVQPKTLKKHHDNLIKLIHNLQNAKNNRFKTQIHSKPEIFSNSDCFRHFQG
jgi:hypothetical protein